MNTKALLVGFVCLWPAVYTQPIGTPDRGEIVYPDDEENTSEEIELGKVLFFDKRLSSNDQTSCASCHNPDLGFGDGMALGLGTMGNKLGRNTPHIYNLAWSSILFWDGRAATLEEQALGPIEAAGEMNMSLDELLPKLKKVPYYAETFKKVYPDSGLTEETLGRAIAAFERSIIVDNTPFDRYMAGDKNAMSPAAIRGMALYQGKAACTDCHSGPNFTDDSFHNIGINNGDRGRAKILEGATMEGAFKTPGLRNVLFTAPYMHDGSLGSLEEVIRHYNNADPSKDKSLSPTLKNIDLSEAEIFDLLAFMGALNQALEIKRPAVP